MRGIRGASELRHQLMNTQSIAEARALLDEFEAQMDEDIQIKIYIIKVEEEFNVPPFVCVKVF